MSIKKVKKQFSAWLKKDWEGYYEGSCINVEKESTHFYYGYHSSMGGTYPAKFPKKMCTKSNPSIVNKLQRVKKRTSKPLSFEEFEAREAKENMQLDEYRKLMKNTEFYS